MVSSVRALAIVFCIASATACGGVVRDIKTACNDYGGTTDTSPAATTYDTIVEARCAKVCGTYRTTYAYVTCKNVVENDSHLTLVVAKRTYLHSGRPMDGETP